MTESKFEWMFDKLNNYFDMLYESGWLSEDEEEEMNEFNDIVIQTIRELEQKERAEVKCNNTRCDYHCGGRCAAPRITLNPLGVCLFQVNSKLPYEKCAKCVYDHLHCDGVLGRKFCVEFEEGEEK